MGLVEKVRVVIADDHPAVRMSLHRLLERQEDIEVIGEAANGEEALELVNRLAPQVLLLDIEMPGMDGIEVAHRLRVERSPVRVLVLSGYADDEYIRLVIDQGVYGYLIKDEPPAQIANAIRQVAGGKKIAYKRKPVTDYSLGFQRLGGHLG